MKVSIITVCLNSEKTIRDTINSVLSQSYKNIEHIFVDGGSKDSTISLIKNNPNKKKIIIKKDTNIYEAINLGIKKSTGKIIQILNSDDILENNNIIKEVVNKIKKNPNYNIYLGDVIFFSNNNFHKINRYFQTTKSNINNLNNGSMLPHPSSFIKKSFYEKFGFYDPKYIIAADFDFFYRSLFVNKNKFFLLKKNIVRVRAGGVSDQRLKSYLSISKEISLSLKVIKIWHMFLIYTRFIRKLNEFYFNRKSLNSKFKIFNYLFDQSHYQQRTCKIITSSKLIPFKKNFVLSALNLAFLGYYAKKSVEFYNTLYHWPDGIFGKKLAGINKLPGSKLLNTLKLPHHIKTIHVMGNLTLKSKLFLIKKFNKKIINTNISYAPIKDQNIKKIKLAKDELTLITLPTPKQEILASKIIKNNINYNIICIGGSIPISSGEISIVPDIFENYEFIWRLKTDPYRRIIRLIDSYYNFLKGKYINKIYNKLIFKVIEK